MKPKDKPKLSKPANPFHFPNSFFCELFFGKKAMWDPNYSNTSCIDAIVIALKEYNLPHQLIDIGLADKTQMRMLITRSSVFLESHMHNPDCDGHSETTSKQFARKWLYEHPTEWCYYDYLGYSRDDAKKHKINTKDFSSYIYPGTCHAMGIKGTCSYGESCIYVHPTKECVYHKQGYCKHGQFCKFKHGGKTSKGA